ncbi:MAG: hypothetical protein QOG71_3138 [Pyrinomonadaceae bacterium]|nr:hypothetical protein [Pyrinomonadaceae bacterium]
MKPHRILTHLQTFKPTVLAAALLAAFLGLCAFGIVSSTAQSTPKEERELEDKIPKHLPIKVKVKNLNSEKWARDLEIEIENRSDKPIYYLGLTVILPDVLTENNHKLGFPLQYGRGNLIDYNAPLQRDDVPIKPGESYIFRIPSHLYQEWDRFVTRRALPKNKPKKIRLVFKSLNFGDGTGFGTTDGIPVDIHQKQIGSSCVKDEKIGGNVMYVLTSSPNSPS